MKRHSQVTVHVMAKNQRCVSHRQEFPWSSAPRSEHLFKACRRKRIRCWRPYDIQSVVRTASQFEEWNRLSSEHRHDEEGRVQASGDRISSTKTQMLFSARIELLEESLQAWERPAPNRSCAPLPWIGIYAPVKSLKCRVQWKLDMATPLAMNTGLRRGEARGQGKEGSVHRRFQRRRCAPSREVTVVVKPPCWPL